MDVSMNDTAPPAEPEATTMVEPEVATVVEPEVPKVAAAFNDLALVPDKNHCLVLSREPKDSTEWSWFFQRLFNDWTERIQYDAGWLAYCKQTLVDLNSMDEKRRLILYRLFYNFLVCHHDALMTAQCIFHTQTLMFSSDNAHTTKLRQSGNLRIQPIGIGNSGVAFLLLATEDYPNRWFIAHANLMGEVVSVQQLASRQGLTNLTEEYVRSQRTQQFHVDEHFVLNQATPIASDVTNMTTVVMYAKCDSFSQMSGPIQIALFTPGLPTVHMTLQNTDYAVHKRCMVAAYMTFVAVALTEPNGDRLTKLLIYRADSPTVAPAVFSRVAVPKRDGEAIPDAGQNAPIAGITSIRFDSLDFGRMWVAYDDGTISSWRLPSADQVPNVQKWSEICIEFCLASMMTRRVGMTPEQALQQTEASPELGKIDLCQPVVRIQPEMGFNGRVVTISPNNVWVFTQDARTNGAQTPSITDVNGANGEQIGTLPVVHCPGLDNAISASTAGNYMIIHYHTDNCVQVLSLRDNKLIWFQRLSQLLAHLHRSGDKPVSSSEKTSSEKYQATSSYQSTWASLGRAAVLLPTGDVLIMDGLDTPIKHQQEPVEDDAMKQ